MNASIQQPARIRFRAQTAIAWGVLVFVSGNHGIDGADLPPPPLSPVERPWLIEQVTRRTHLPLFGFWEKTLCMPPTEHALKGVDARDRESERTWAKSADGSWGLGDVFLEHRWVVNGVELTETVSGQPLTKDQPAAYLLIIIRTRRPVAVDRDFAGNGKEFARYTVSSPQQRRVGQFIGLYDLGPNRKALIFEGQWKDVASVTLTDSGGMSESLLSETLPFPYRALGLSVTQIRRVEGELKNHATRLRPLQIQYAKAQAERRKTLEKQMRDAMAATEQRVERVLNDAQGQSLAELRKSEFCLREQEPARIDAARVVEPSGLPWLIVAVKRYAYFPLDRFARRRRLWGPPGSVVQCYDADDHRRDIMEMGGRRQVDRYFTPQESMQPRYLVICLQLNEPVAWQSEKDRDRAYAKLHRFTVHSVEGEAVADFRAIAVEDIKDHTPTSGRYVDLVFEGYLGKNETLILADDLRRACSLQPKLEIAAMRLFDEGLVSDAVLSQLQQNVGLDQKGQTLVTATLQHALDAAGGPAVRDAKKGTKPRKPPGVAGR